MLFRNGLENLIIVSGFSFETFTVWKMNFAISIKSKMNKNGYMLLMRSGIVLFLLTEDIKNQKQTIKGV